MSGQPIQHVTALLFRQKHNIEKSIIGSSWCAGLNRSAVGSDGAWHEAKRAGEAKGR